MYKEKSFSFRKLEDVFYDLELARRSYHYVNRIFIADGNALSMKTEYLTAIFEKINELFPECQRIGIYGAPKDILRKTKDELAGLNSLGLGIIYLGLESGSDKVLKLINKGVTSEEMVAAATIIKNTGIKLSVTAISGLGGKLYTKEHGIETGKILSRMNPDYIGILTLMVEEETVLAKMISDGEFTLLNPVEVMEEMKLMVENINVEDCIFRSNHASNYFSFFGHLPDEKEVVLEQVNHALQSEDGFKSEFFRSL
jgi:radical SAM superfamily enzyme YgiQ (UPF0313 family)